MNFINGLDSTFITTVIQILFGIAFLLFICSKIYSLIYASRLEKKLFTYKEKLIYNIFKWFFLLFSIFIMLIALVEVFEKDSIFDHPPREIFLLVFYCILLSFTLLVFLYPIKDLIRWFKPLPKCNYYYFTENGSKFYIIKPTANNEFIVGDAGEEYESSTFKIVSKEEIKEHTLHKEKVKIPSKNLKSIYNSLKNRFKRKTVKDT